MVILHILAILYLVAAGMTWLNVIASATRTAKGAHVYAWYVLPVVLAIYALTR